MSEEEKRAIERIRYLQQDIEHRKIDCNAIDIVLNYIDKLQEENEELKQDNKEWKMIFDKGNKRTYRKKYVEERRKEQPNLLYPDFDEVYERYYKLQKENKELKDSRKVLSKELLSDKAIIVLLKQENKKLQEEIQEYEDMITHYNQSQKIYSKIKDKIKELEMKRIGASTGIYAIQIDVLKELLEE